MVYDLYNIYLMMFHEGKKKAIIKQEKEIVKFHNPYGYKGIVKVYKISDQIKYMEEESLNEKRS